MSITLWLVIATTNNDPHVVGNLLLAPRLINETENTFCKHLQSTFNK